MENTNIRTLDDLGRIAIPKEVRKAVKISEGDKLDILTTTDGAILLRKVEDDQPIYDIKADEPWIIHLINEYEEKTKVIKITPEQDRLLHWLWDERFLHSDVVIGDGYPFPELKDLT